MNQRLLLAGWFTGADLRQRREKAAARARLFFGIDQPLQSTVA
jgi:hypothetical protein